MTHLRNQSPAFVFLAHPRDKVDLRVIPGSSFIYDHSSSEAEFVERMLMLPPTVSSEITFGFDPVRGEMLVVLCLPEGIMTPSGRRRVEEGLEVAISRGTSVVGLGALTAPATRGGVTLLPMVPRGLTLTTGNAFTALVARDNVREASKALGLGSDAVVAVVGCTGSVGVAASRLLARDGHRLILVGRSEARVHKELADLIPAARVSGTVADTADADILLLVTGDQTARITPELPKPGAIVLDLAHPVNIPKHEYSRFLARDVRVAQGGLVVIPGYQCRTDIRLPDRKCTLACLAETYLFAKAGITEHSVGQARVELALELERIAPRYNAHVRPLDLDIDQATVAPPGSGSPDAVAARA